MVKVLVREILQPELDSKNPYKHGNTEHLISTYAPWQVTFPSPPVCTLLHPSQKITPLYTHTEFHAHTGSHGNKSSCVYNKELHKLLKGTDTQRDMYVTSETQAHSMTFPLPIS